MIRLNLHAAALDHNGETVRLGDVVALVSDRQHEATVVTIIGGFYSSNIEIEFSTGARETAFGADVVRIG